MREGTHERKCWRLARANRQAAPEGSFIWKRKRAKFVDRARDGAQCYPESLQRQFILLRPGQKCGLGRFAGDNEERIAFDTRKLRAQALRIVVLLDVDNLFRGGHYIQGNVSIVASF
jgi:hypothetical protein